MAATEQSTRANVALDDLYRRHVGDVYRYTYAVLGNHADAEDVTQTTFVNALRALERGEQPRNASNWLLAIAHNLVRQRWRQAAARPTEIELVGDVAADAQEDDLELDDLVKALQMIPPAQREALVMRELEGRSYQEISELLGVTNSALETLLFRARRSLADELENLVTCQTAELAMSQRLDGRLSRKERRRLKDHLGECAPCARRAELQGKQRRAFKGLALLPLPVGLTLFKGVPSATAAAGLSSIGGAATAASGGSAASVGATTTTTVGLTGVGVGGAAATGGAAVGGSVVGGALAKVAAVVVAATVATGVGYQGLEVIRADAPEPTKRQVDRVGTAPAKGTTQRAAARRSASFSPAPVVASAPANRLRESPPANAAWRRRPARTDRRCATGGNVREAVGSGRPDAGHSVERARPVARDTSDGCASGGRDDASHDGRPRARARPVADRWDGSVAVEWDVRPTTNGCPGGGRVPVAAPAAVSEAGSANGRFPRPAAVGRLERQRPRRRSAPQGADRQRRPGEAREALERPGTVPSFEGCDIRPQGSIWCGMPRGRHIALLVVALALAAAAAASLAPQATARSTNSVSATRVVSLEELLLRQVNALRQANGLGALSHSGALTQAAALHSRAMATLGFFAHESRNGASFSTRVGRFYRPRSRGVHLGENLATFGGGMPTAEAIVSAWMASPGHKAILLQRTFREAGIGIVHHPQAGGVFGGLPTWVITLDVGRR